MIRVLAAAEPMTVTIDGKRTTIWMLFVGNGRYSPADQVPMSRPEMNRGLLDVRYLRADKKILALTSAVCGCHRNIGQLAGLRSRTRLVDVGSSRRFTGSHRHRR